MTDHITLPRAAAIKAREMLLSAYGNTDWWTDDEYAALVAAQEREACAKYLDDCGEHEHANFVRSRGEVKP
jgi:hypothetical protein